MSDKRRPPRRKVKGNTGISATHITVWTMNGEPMPEEMIQECEAFLAKLYKENSARILVQIVKV